MAIAVSLAECSSAPSFPTQVVRPDAATMAFTFFLFSGRNHKGPFPLSLSPDLDLSWILCGFATIWAVWYPAEILRPTPNSGKPGHDHSHGAIKGISAFSGRIDAMQFPRSPAEWLELMLIQFSLPSAQLRNQCLHQPGNYASNCLVHLAPFGSMDAIGHGSNDFCLSKMFRRFL